MKNVINLEDLNLNKEIAIVGIQKSGVAAATFLRSLGAELALFDEAPVDAGQLRMHKIDDMPVHVAPFDDRSFRRFDLLVVSPGVDIREKPFDDFEGEIIGDVEIFARYINVLNSGLSPKDRKKIVAVSGSNGKSTVTELTTHILNFMEQKAVAIGNIGVPVLSVLGEDYDIFVIELSSFQIETVSSLRSDVAVVLNISEDHLSRYENLLDYAMVKSRIYSKTDLQIVNEDDLLVRAMRYPNVPSLSFGVRSHADFHLSEKGGSTYLSFRKDRVFNLDQFNLIGKHNYSNALAALALSSSVCDYELHRLAIAIPSFRGLPHRVELVDSFDGIDFYDDSKGTNIGATATALQGFESLNPNPSIVLIAGGQGKNQDFSELAKVAEKNVKKLCLIGIDAPQISNAIRTYTSDIKVEIFKSLEMATVSAYRFAKEEGCSIVLLSPACASKDMFNGYSHRADVFVDTVHKCHYLDDKALDDLNF